MNTLLEHFFDGCDKWGKENYGKGFSVYRGNNNGFYQKSMKYALNYMIGKLNEKNSVKTKPKANKKSKQKTIKQVKGVLKIKKAVLREKPSM